MAKNRNIEVLKSIYDASDNGKMVKIILKNGETFKATAVNWTETETETDEDAIAIRVLREDGEYDTLAGEWIESFETDDQEAEDEAGEG